MAKNNKAANLLLAQCSSKKKMKVEMENNFLVQCSNKKKSGEITSVSTLTPSPSDKSSSRNLYICTAITESEVDNVVWYKINPNISTGYSDDEQIPRISSVCSIPLSQVGFGFSPASIGSKLYMIGGSHFRYEGGSKDMYCIDTQQHQGDDDDDQSETLVCRKLQTDTLAQRQASAVVSTHGKIYVFGGSQWTDTHPWAEVFDPSMNKWSPLPQPPHELREARRTIFDAVVGDTILLSREAILASFNVKTNSWDLLESNPLRNSLSNSGVIALDDVLFMFDMCSVVAYDVVAHKWFKEPVRGLELESMSFLDHTDPPSQGNVVHLGDKNLCVIWHDEVEGGCYYEEGDEEYYVRCVKFRVSRIYDTEKEEEVLQAEVLARSAYRTLSGGNCLLGCFPI